MAAEWKVISTESLTSRNRIKPPERLWQHILSSFRGNDSISYFSYDETKGLGMITNWDNNEHQEMGYSTFEGKSQLTLSQKMIDKVLGGAEKGDVLVFLSHEGLLEGDNRGTYIGQEETVCKLLPHYDDMEMSESNTSSSSETSSGE